MFAEDSKEPCSFIRIDFEPWPDSPEKWPKVIQQQCCQQSAGIGADASDAESLSFEEILVAALQVRESRPLLAVPDHMDKFRHLVHNFIFAETKITH